VFIHSLAPPICITLNMRIRIKTSLITSRFVDGALFI
jgi:hypothetical protein